MLASAWAGALAGVAMSVAWITAPRVLVAACYLALGWVSVIAMPQLAGELGVAPFVLFAVGGVLYTVGAVVYALRRPEPVAAHLRLPRGLPRARDRRRRRPLRGDGGLGHPRGRLTTRTLTRAGRVGSPSVRNSRSGAAWSQNGQPSVAAAPVGPARWTGASQRGQASEPEASRRVRAGRSSSNRMSTPRV